MSEFNWTCPFCNRAQTVSDAKLDYSHRRISVGECAEGTIGYAVRAIGCSNPECKKVEIRAFYGNAKFDGLGNLIRIDPIRAVALAPESTAKSIPDYVPASIRQDYYEACRIRDLSPKAAATLIRRCLQGLIRHFCGISKKRLFDEIDALRKAVEDGSVAQGVTADSVDAIDHVRSIGNIGAHMERDIGVIVDVEPNEAQILIELIEMLFDEWYVARHTREQRLARLKEISGEKDTAKKALPRPEKAIKA